MAGMAKESIVIHQSIAASCLANRDRFVVSIQNLFASSVRSVALRLTAFFESTYLCEEAFAPTKIIK